MINRFAVRVFAILACIFLSAGKSFADLPAPIAVPLTIAVTKNSSAQIAFVGQHTTGGGFTYLVKTMPAHGQLSAIVDDHVTYAPDNNYVGNDSFTYSVTDSVGESNPAVVSITVSPAAVPVVSLPALSALALITLATLLSGVVLRYRAFV